MARLKRFLIIFFTGTTSVLPTLWGDFVFDDGEAIVKNSDVIEPGWQNTLKIFKNDFWGVDVTHRLSHKSYRPLTTLTYRLEYYLWGRNPFPFHLFDILLHGLNCILVYTFLNKFLQPNPHLVCAKAEKLAFWGSILFSVHPVHVEPLGAIVGRADLLGAAIFLGGFCSVRKHNTVVGAILLALFSLLGAFFKETAITLSVLAISAELRNANIHSPVAIKRWVVFRCLIIAVITASFVFWRLWMQAGPPVFQPFDNPPAFAPSAFSKMVSILYIWVLNVILLLSPIWLCYDWSMGCVKIIDSFWDPRCFLVIIFVIVCSRVAYIAFKNRLIMTCAIIFASTFLPSSNLLFVVGFVLAERNLYLPSIGYCLFVAYAFIKHRQRKYLIFVISMFYLRSLHRSGDWASQGSLFRSALQVCPNNAKIHYNLGTLHGEFGDYVGAEKSYKTAISLRPGYYQAMNNLGNLLRVHGKPEEAEIWLRKAVASKPDFAAAWMNLGIILSHKNQSEALDCYQNALTHRKAYPDCEYNLGNLYLDMGNKVRALRAWQRATTLKPGHAQAWINSVILLEQDGSLVEAKEIALRGLRQMKSHDTMLFLLGNILGKLAEFESAESSFEKAIQIRAKKGKDIPPKYYSNLGVLYHRWGKKDEAVKAYETALVLDPDSASTKKNLEMLLKGE